METPLLSICLITYNHAAYIRQAVESVLKQRAGFAFELIIADDCSTDGTRDIISEYKKQYPDRIRLILQEKNVGPAHNWLDLMAAPASKYIAYLEGDDYWTDRDKLQKQVDFLESNPAYSLCFHDVFVLKNGKKRRGFHWDAPDTSDIQYILKKGNYISSLSVVYRNSPTILAFLKKFTEAPFGDYILYIAAAREGLLKFLPQRMGVYRVHAGGGWSLVSVPKAIEKTILVTRLLFLELPEEWRSFVKIRYLTLLEEYFRFAGFNHLKEDGIRFDIPEMGIEPFVIDYIREGIAEKTKTGYYVKNIPVSTLFRALLQKPLNRLSV